MGPTGRVVVVGAGLAGAKAVETLRDEGFTGPVTLVGEEPERPYERPPLSKGLLVGTTVRDEVYVHGTGWYDASDVDLRTGVRVTALDPAAHRVRLDTGEELPYDRLLLATGATPRRLRVPGADLDGVLLLRTLAESDRLRAALAGGGRRVVVVGGGWIGLEVTAAARAYGNAVTVVEPLPTPLYRALGPQMGEVFARLHRDHGVDLRTGVGVRALGRRDGRATSVELDDGGVLPADLVVVGVGAAPADGLAAAAGLDVDDGVRTDAGLRTSAPDVYAAGDVAAVHTPRYGRHLRVEHWANALNSGPAAARSMLGQEVTYDRVPYFYSDQYELGMEYSGLGGPEDRVVCRGDVQGGTFVAFWLDAAGRVTAGMNVGVWDVTGPIQELIRSGRPVPVELLTDPDVPLEELAARSVG